jgi:hypothetical protein
MLNQASRDCNGWAVSMREAEIEPLVGFLLGYEVQDFCVYFWQAASGRRSCRHFWQLLQGIYSGSSTVGEPKQHGNFGLGTREGLDGRR